MKAIPASNEDVNSIIEFVRSILANAIAENRTIRFEASRQFYELPSSGPVIEYGETGEVTIEISTGLKGSAKYIVESKA